MIPWQQDRNSRVNATPDREIHTLRLLQPIDRLAATLRLCAMDDRGGTVQRGRRREGMETVVLPFPRRTQLRPRYKIVSI